MSKMQRAVQKSAKEAEELHREIYGDPAPEGEEGATEEVVESKATTETAPPEQAPVESKTTVEDAPPPPPPEPEKDQWEHKYKTLQGMYNREVPELQGKIRKLQGEKEGLENIIATMSTGPAPAEGAAPKASKLVTEEEIADWGPEMTDYFRRLATEQYAGDLEELRAENRKLQNQNLQLQKSVGTVEADRSADGRSRLLAALAEQVPDWQEINVSPDFLNWLDSSDAFSGRSRHELLLEAYEGNDTPRVAAFFKSFKRDKAVVSEAPKAPAAPAQPTVRLDTLVAPGKAPSTTTQPSSDAGNDQKVWGQSEIQQFYRDVQRGVYRGKDAEKTRIEAAIVKAGREGRVQ